MSKRFYTLFSLGLAVILGAALFLTSERVQQAQKDLRVVKEKVAVERDSLRILNAEWTFLNRPDRLEKLAQTYLHLTQGSAAQMLDTPDAIPEPVMPVLPGIKPAFAPADMTGVEPASGDTQGAVSVSTIALNVSAPRAAIPKNTTQFNSLITRIADTPDAP
jgi:hypothetical protein